MLCDGAIDDDLAKQEIHSFEFDSVVAAIRPYNYKNSFKKQLVDT
jgi:hypothetical protein